MITPEATAKFLRKAALHAQFTVERADLDDNVPGDGHTARVAATIVRVFRGDAKWVGRQTVVEVPCVVPGAEPAESGIWWSPVGRLEQAKMIEAYLSPREENFEVVLGVNYRLDAPTEVAQLDEFGWPAEERAHVSEVRTKVGASGSRVSHTEGLSVIAVMGALVAVVVAIIWYLGRA